MRRYFISFLFLGSIVAETGRGDDAVPLKTLTEFKQATVFVKVEVGALAASGSGFVMKSDDTVEARPITAGITYDGIRVITSGLKPGETVVTDGQVRLTAGAKVSVTSPNAIADTNSPAGEL